MKKFISLVLIMIMISSSLGAYAYQYRENGITFDVDNGVWERNDKYNDGWLFILKGNKNERIYIQNTTATGKIITRDNMTQKEVEQLCYNYAESLYTEEVLEENLSNFNNGATFEVDVKITSDSNYREMSYTAKSDKYADSTMYCLYIAKSVAGQCYLIEYKYANGTPSTESKETVMKIVDNIRATAELRINGNDIPQEKYITKNEVGIDFGYIGPFLYLERTMAPVRICAESLNYNVMWNSEKSLATLYNSDESSFLTMYVDKKEHLEVNKYFSSESEKEVFEVGANITIEKMKEYFHEAFSEKKETIYTLFGNEINSEIENAGKFSAESIIKAAEDYVKNSQEFEIEGEGKEKKIIKENSNFSISSKDNPYPQSDIETFFNSDCINENENDVYKLFGQTIECENNSFKIEDIKKVINNCNFIEKYPVKISFEIKEKKAVKEEGEKYEITRSYSFADPQIPDIIKELNKENLLFDQSKGLCMSRKGLKNLFGVEYDPNSLSQDNSGIYTVKGNDNKVYTCIKSGEQHVFPIDSLAQNDKVIFANKTEGKLVKKNNITIGISDIVIDEYYTAKIEFNNGEINCVTSGINDNAVAENVSELPKDIEIKSDGKNSEEKPNVVIEDVKDNNHLCKLIIYKKVNGTFTKLEKYAFKSSVKTDDNTRPTVYNGRTMLPLRVVGEMLGASVGWDGEKNAATLDTTVSENTSTPDVGT